MGAAIQIVPVADSHELVGVHPSQGPCKECDHLLEVWVNLAEAHAGNLRVLSKRRNILSADAASTILENAARAQREAEQARAELQAHRRNHEHETRTLIIRLHKVEV